MSPIQSLLKSRKFLLLCFDQLIALILFIVAMIKPEWTEHVKVLLAIMQPVFVAIILAIAVEDSAEKSAGTYYTVAKDDLDLDGEG